MSRKTVSGVLASAVATGGTFTVAYPTGFDRGSFAQGYRHKLSAIGKVFTAPENMTLSFGATSVTVTYNGTTTLAAGTAFTFEFDRPGVYNPVEDTTSGKWMYTPCPVVRLDLGSPAVADVDGYCVAQAKLAAGALSLNGALVVSGVGVADARTGRNVIVDGSDAGDTTQIVTVTGTDMYGDAMVETIAMNGTTVVPGIKAFKTITSISVSAALAGNIFVGTGDLFGIPVYLPSAGHILKELENGAAATTGTTVAGLTLATKPTATTADVRGTYDPNSAADGSKAFALICALPDPDFLGATQYAG